MKSGMRIRTGVFLAAVLLISGCGGRGAEDTPKTAPGSQTGNGMGRYMETFCEMPQEINRNGGVNWLDDGSLTVISFGEGLYRSADEGQTWEKEETAWYPMIEGVYCVSAVMGPDGSVAASCIGEMTEAARKALGRDLPEDWEGNYCIFAEPDGSVKTVDFGFRQEDGNGIESFVFKEDGRLFAEDMDGKVYEVDPKQERVRELFAAERSVGYMDFSGETLMAVGADRLYLYDLQKEVLLPQDETVDAYIRQVLADGTTAYTGGGYPLAVTGSPEGNVIYVASRDGMYRHVLGGSAMEQVVDGALSVFGDASSVLYRIRVPKDQEFLAVFQPSVGLVHYRYDGEIPSMPEKEIRIYSLREDRGLREAVTAYKRAHPDIYVRYEIGMDGSSGMTEEDARKRLNTQVLSGEGPDVLLLDGLPLDTYIEKGMLKDLRSVLPGEALFPNVLEGFTREDGAVYAMPMRIRVPLMAGDRDLIASMGDLEAIAEETERFRSTCPEGGIFGNYEPETLLRLFGMVSSSAWIDEEGRMDEERIAEFLSLVKRIYDAERAGTVPEQAAQWREEAEEMEQYGMDPDEFRMEVCNNVLEIPRGYVRAAGGYVEGIMLCLDNVTSVLRTDGSLDYRIFAGQVADPFLPCALVGIGAGTTQPEAAEEFVRMAFGAEVQSRIYNGFPVNRSAYEAQFDNMDDSADNGSMTLILDDGTEQELVLYWPDEGEQRTFTEYLEQLGTPVMTDSYLCELVYETGVKVLEGECGAEEGAAEIARKASIYLEE